MSDYSSLKATINANVKANNNHEITGSIMNSVLNAMVNSLGAGYQFMGVATPTNPGSAQTPDYKCFYLATTPGTYTNLGGLVVADGEVALLKYDSSWTKEVTGIASADKLNQLGQEVSDVIGGDYAPSLNIEQGSIDSATGDNHSSDSRIRTANYIKADRIIITTSGSKVYVMGYKDNGTFVSAVGWITTDETVSISGADKYRFIFAKSDDSNLTPADFSSLGITITSEYDGTLATKESLEAVVEETQDLDKNIDTILNNVNITLTEDKWYTSSGSYEGSLYFKAIPKTTFATKSKLQYKLTGVNGSYAIAFYDKNLNFLEDISIQPSSDSTGVTVEGELNLADDDYADAFYIGICNLSNYGYYARFVSTVQKEFSSIKEELKELDDETVELTIDGYYNGSGQFVSSPYFESTNKIAIERRILKYKLTGTNGSYVIALFNNNNQFLSSLSIQPTQSSEENITVEGEIDFSKPAYSEVAYIGICNLKGKSHFVYYNSVTVYVIDKNVKNNIYYGKKVAALGDSITYGYLVGGKSWYDKLVSYIGASSLSFKDAYAGQCLRTMADRLTSSKMSDVDLLFVFGGTNQVNGFNIGAITDAPTPDWWQPNTEYSVGDKVQGGTMIQEHSAECYYYMYQYECVSSGTSGSTPDATGFNTETDSITEDGTVQWKCLGSPSWYSDLWRVLKKVLTLNPNTRIVWIVPIKNTSNIDHEEEDTANYAKFQAIRNFCKYNSIPYIDLFREFSINRYNHAQLMVDWLHPNESGYKQIADVIYGHIV